MPLFTRRRLQSMLTELDPFLERGKATDLVNRLNNKRILQALPAEAEVSILWALSKLGDFENEPYWWGDNHRPEAYTENLIPNQPAVIEVLAMHDASISGEEDMDRIAVQMMKCADEVRPKSGRYLYFMFGEESGYDNRRYFRRRLAPKDYMLSASASAGIQKWILSQPADRCRLQIIEIGLHVEIEKRAHPQRRFHNFHCSMPPEVYDIDGNPLYDGLRKKLDQLAAAHRGTYRFICVMDVGSTLLRKLGSSGERDRMRRYFSAREIIEYFVSKYSDRVDAIVVFAARRVSRDWFGGSRGDSLTWAVTPISRPGLELPANSFERLRQILPSPRFEGYQVRSLFQQDAFSPKRRGFVSGLHITDFRNGTMNVKVSSRALLDLLAGRVSPAQFRSLIGDDEPKNLFQHWLDSGMTISGATFEPRGLDRDDDFLVLTFSDDPGARELKVPRKPEPNASQ